MYKDIYVHYILIKLEKINLKPNGHPFLLQKPVDMMVPDRSKGIESTTLKNLLSRVSSSFRMKKINPICNSCSHFIA